MSEDENFLARWSRRKRAAREEGDLPPAAPESTPEPASTSTDVPAETPRAARAFEPESANVPVPEFDLSKLPSLESITAGTDIRPFLAPGVPQALRSAALRRAWSTDPAIRDFVGLAENAWDFTAPGAIAGFGTLSAAEAARVVASFTQTHLAGEQRETVAQAGETPQQIAQNLGAGAAPRSEPVQAETSDLADGKVPVRPSESLASKVVGPEEAEDTAQSASAAEDADPRPGTPRHGTAMPH